MVGSFFNSVLNISDFRTVILSGGLLEHQIMERLDSLEMIGCSPRTMSVRRPHDYRSWPITKPPIDFAFKLPDKNYGHSMVLTNDLKILVCGGFVRESYECLQLSKRSGNWVFHSYFNFPRSLGTAIVMPNGIYYFGGVRSPETSEFLATGKKNWVQGPTIPKPGFKIGSGVRISDTELLLLGGRGSESRILKYNIGNRQWTRLNDMIVRRSEHSSCVFDGKIIVTGGINALYDESYLRTEVIQLSDMTSRLAGPHKIRRQNHSMAITTLEQKPVLVAFAGTSSDSVEVWDTKNEQWTYPYVHAESGYVRLDLPCRTYAGCVSVPTAFLFEFMM